MQAVIVLTMVERMVDGSAGDAAYGIIGTSYSRYRRPDPRIAAAVTAALGDARTVLNVGAGAGSYEPMDRTVTAVEPSASMRAQRPASLPPAVDATAEALPFPDGSFDAAMTTFSVHQWQDPAAGLREVRRVTRGPVVVLTCDPQLLDRFWLADYVLEVIATEARRYPPLSVLATGSAAGRPPSLCRSRSTARTASTRRTTVGPKACSTHRHGCPVQRGASSSPVCTSASSLTLPATSKQARGTTSTGPSASS